MTHLFAGYARKVYKRNTFDRAVAIATAEEADTKDIKEISQHGSPQVNTVKQTPRPHRGAY